MSAHNPRLASIVSTTLLTPEVSSEGWQQDPKDPVRLNIFQEVCKQFTTDCSSASFTALIDLGQGDFLIIQEGLQRRPSFSAGTRANLLSFGLSNAEEDAVYPSFNKAVPKF
ncbi:hypothetical protein [Bradyrhizobium sp. BR 1432]|uniref:hypothetical protein n=1 Tax=Bradyrhizobium sp. BR 1432 TaxID=3447966 RepID=UPI003EE4E65D